MDNKGSNQRLSGSDMSSKLEGLAKADSEKCAQDHENGHGQAKDDGEIISQPDLNMFDDTFSTHGVTD